MKRPDQIKNAPDQGERVPPGQFLTKKFPVLTYGSTPKIDLGAWRMRVFGLVAQEVELTWEQFSGLGWTTVTADFHCVTQWSCLDNTWEGILVSDLAALAQPKSEARFVMAHCFGGYSANLPLDMAMEEGLLVHKHNGEVLGEGHGWPLRLIVPAATDGRAPSGSTASNSWRKTPPASGNNGDTTTTATLGWKRGSGRS